MPVPAFVDGCWLRVDPYRGLQVYDRIVITCPLHGACEKKRDRHGAQCEHFGPMEPIAYLAVRASKAAEFTEATHTNACKPELSAVRQWLVQNGHIQP